MLYKDYVFIGILVAVCSAIFTTLGIWFGKVLERLKQHKVENEKGTRTKDLRELYYLYGARSAVARILDDNKDPEYTHYVNDDISVIVSYKDIYKYLSSYIDYLNDKIKKGDNI